jgi:tripartite-type tricarboxylate transporter receptor subunit TctC
MSRKRPNIMTLVRRQLLRLVGAAVSAAAIYGTARAQAYPTRPVRVIVPVAAGGPNDLIARIIAQKLSERWSNSFYVENIPAGATTLGTATTAKAPPDGYTIEVATNSFFINSSLYAKLPYDPIRDFTPVTLLAASPIVLVVHPSIAARNVKELVALVKANPGKYSYASAGTGQPGHLAAELFKVSLGLDITHVPFNGAAPAITSTLGGHTPISFVAVPLASTNIGGGKLRALAVMSNRRSPALPDVPTMAEQGFPDEEAALLQGVLLPAGAPNDIVDWWYRELTRIVALADVKERLSVLGLEPVVNRPEEFAAQIKTEITRWAKVIAAAGIQKIE